MDSLMNEEARFCSRKAKTDARSNDDHLQLPITLNTPLRAIPPLGFGTWNLKIDHENTTASVAAAIEAGYVHIDCAAAYGNQQDVGKGIKHGLERSGKAREAIWVTSKLWNDHHDPAKVESGLNSTLKELDLDYIDLYLMHWPVGNEPRTGELDYDYVSTWQAMEKLLELGTVRHIGITNFSPHQLHKLMRHGRVRPAVHQMELHPYLQQREWIEFHRVHGIAVTAYSPLGNTNPTYHKHADSGPKSTTGEESEEPPPLLENKVLSSIAEERGCTVAQVALAWGMARGTSVIPKSSHVSRIHENLKAVNCPLSVSDMARITAMESRWLKRFNNPSEGWGVHLFDGLDDA